MDFPDAGMFRSLNGRPCLPWASVKPLFATASLEQSISENMFYLAAATELSGYWGLVHVFRFVDTCESISCIFAGSAGVH